MKNLNEYIQESSNPYESITKIIEEWTNKPINQKWMYEVLGAITKGLQNSLEYRTNSANKDADDSLYKKATEVLDRFVKQLK